MKKYESLFILDVRKVEDEGNALSKEFCGLVESWGGKITAADAMGRLQFSYEIKKRKAGIYWDFHFELAEEKVNQIKEHYALDERVLRILTVIDERPENAVTCFQTPIADDAAAIR